MLEVGNGSTYTPSWQALRIVLLKLGTWAGSACKNGEVRGDSAAPRFVMGTSGDWWIRAVESARGREWIDPDDQTKWEKNV